MVPQVQAQWVELLSHGGPASLQGSPNPALHTEGAQGLPARDKLCELCGWSQWSMAESGTLYKEPSPRLPQGWWTRAPESGGQGCPAQWERQVQAGALRRGNCVSPIEEMQRRNALAE